MQRGNTADRLNSRLAAPMAYVAGNEAHSRVCAMEALLEQGFVCRDFARTSDLLDAFESETPDLIVMDVSLREFDATEALRCLQANRFQGSIIPITEHDTSVAEPLQRLGRTCGLKMLPCVAKPVRLRNFEASLDHIDPPPSRTELLVDIEEAIRNNWVTLWYQPKVDLTSLSFCGAEALVRLLHPRLGSVPPSRFLPEATDPGMRLLSHFVVEHAAHDWMTLVEQGRSLEMAVNIPMHLLTQPQFIRVVRNKLPIHPRFSGIIVDVDGAAVAARPDITAQLAAELRRLDMKISIADLTSCPPSLADAESFPFSEIKLGRQFVSGCGSDKLKLAICRTVVDVARRFAALSVAVGVETRDDLAAVRDLGFDMAQGFFFGRPMPLQELALLLATRRGGFRDRQTSKESM